MKFIPIIVICLIAYAVYKHKERQKHSVSDDETIIEKVPTEDEIKDYPPFGSPGITDGEVRTTENDIDYIWVESVKKWIEY